jgi:rubrerythrin
MSNEKAIDAIKGAILLEKKGKAFYETVARQTESAAVREIFEMMSAEESTHVEILQKHYDKLMKEGQFAPAEYEKKAEKFDAQILTTRIKEEVAAAGYEAAAISAAMAMEDRAVAFYSERARASDDAMEKKLFEWLSNWEKTHLQFLSEVDRELQQSVWHDSNFWPM